MTQLLTSLWQDESGQALAEYGLILALIAVVVIVGLTAMGTSINDMFNSLADRILPAS